MSGSVTFPTASQSTIDAQTAFVGLLAEPLVTPETHPALHRSVRLHFQQLTEWCSRCGYRFVTVGQAVRMHRPPLAGDVAVPPPLNPPRRRELVLTLSAAAACEETDGTTTVQQLSDLVRALTSVDTTPVIPYNPDLRSERYAFVRALGRLERHGVLRRRTRSEEALRTWEEDRVGVGAGYEVDRDALLQVTDPAIVQSVLRPRPFRDAATEAAAEAMRETRRRRLLRRLIETPVLLFDDLDSEDAEYARSQRTQLAQAAAEMTGGAVEMRAEGMLLVLPADRLTTPAATLEWPRVTAAATLTLLLLDRALDLLAPSVAPAPGGDGTPGRGWPQLPSYVVDELVEALFKEKSAWLTAELKAGPDRVRAVAEELLIGAGLIRTTSERAWVVLPVAARFRDPVIAAGGDAASVPADPTVPAPPAPISQELFSSKESV